MTSTISPYRLLHRGLSRRPTPEEVSEIIRPMLADDLTLAELSMFPKTRWKSSMSADWDKPVSLQKQVDTLNAILEKQWPGVGTTTDGADPREVRDLLAVARDLMGMVSGKTSFKDDRLNRAERSKQRRKRPGLAAISRRRYDKLFRICARLEREVGDLEDQQHLSDLARFAKIGFADHVTFHHFRKSALTAAFVSYYTANLGRRSIFTSGKQAKALDKVGEMLLTHLEADPKTSWLAVAHVFPRWDIVARLTLRERVELLDKSRAVLEDVALRLKACVTPTMNLDEMIVRRGDDSSTWNALAGSWNKARDMWFAVGWSIDPSIMDAFAPGKVMRLMAADVVAWHRRTNGLDPDTRVWASLPRPWEVMLGETTCTREQVFSACLAAGVDPSTSGWAKPRPRTAVDEIYSTPELVHGVVISHPQLAALLRKAGYFGGSSKAKKVKEVAPVIAEAAEIERASHAGAFGPKP